MMDQINLPIDRLVTPEDIQQMMHLTVDLGDDKVMARAWGLDQTS